MLFIKEEKTQKPLKDIDTLEDLAFPKISIKTLYKLKISIVREI
jgi:hypothetical protein